MVPPAVSVEGLLVRHGSFVAVDGVTFEVAPGQILALLGPNGAGKTSMLDVVVGQRGADAGRVRVLGLDPRRDHARMVERIGVMTQDGGVHPGIRAREATRLYASFYDQADDPDEALARVGLSGRAGSKWRTLSGGERQRLSLSLALIGRPEVVFLDEPTAGVDVSGKRTIRSLIRGLGDKGVTVILATHDLADVEALADTVVILDRGRVVATGTPEELTRGGADQDGTRFSARPGLDVTAIGAAVGAPVSEIEPGQYRIDGAADPARIAALTSWLADHDVALGDLRVGRPSLEDVFVQLTTNDR